MTEPAQVWSAVDARMFFSSQPRLIFIQPIPKAFHFAPLDFLCEAIFLIMPPGTKYGFKATPQIFTKFAYLSVLDGANLAWRGTVTVVVGHAYRWLAGLYPAFSAPGGGPFLEGVSRWQPA